MKRRLGNFPAAPALIVLLAIVAGTSLLGVLTGSAVYVASIAGALVAAVAAGGGRRLGLLTAEWTALSIVLVIAGGGFVAGSGLQPDYPEFFTAVVDTWADLLSSVPPVRADRTYRVLPYVLAWLAGAGGFALARLVRVPASAAIAPLSVFGLGLLFTVELRGTAIVQGTLLAVLALALGWFQQRDLGIESDLSIGSTTVKRQRTRMAQGAGVLIAVALLAPLAAPYAPGFGSRERFDLRDRLEPPWNPLDEPSPLAQVKGNYLDATRDEVVFVVQGENIPRRWRLASLGLFDGTVWTVGDTYSAGQAPFVPIDSSLPIDPQWEDGDLTGDLTNVVLTIEVRDLDAPWLPLPGNSVRVEADPLRADVRFNAITRTAAQPSGATGLRYQVEALAPVDRSDLELRDATFPLPQGLGVSKQASTVRNWAADLVEGLDRGWLQVEAVRDDLVEDGFYLATDEASPGHSWARLTDFFSADEVFGFEEQYAAAAAIAVRNADLSARVVVGYLIDEAKLASTEVAVTGQEASAWIEVLTEEHGWVPVDVTPDRDNEPTLEAAGIRTETVAAPNPPPPPPPPAEVEIEPEELEIQLDEDEDDEEDDDQTARGSRRGLLAAGAAAIPLLLVAGWVASVSALKARRRKQRLTAATPDARITGAWHEANDRLIEAGRPHRSDESPRERAAAVTQRSSASPSSAQPDSAQSRPDLAVMHKLARAVDRSAFGPSEATPAEADAAWRDYEQVSSVLAEDASAVERVRRHANRQPLKRRDLVS